MLTLLRREFLIGLMLLLPVGVSAHHSRSYYSTEQVEFEAEILEVLWRNPHIGFMVRRADDTDPNAESRGHPPANTSGFGDRLDADCRRDSVPVIHSNGRSQAERSVKRLSGKAGTLDNAQLSGCV